MLGFSVRSKGIKANSRGVMFPSHDTMTFHDRSVFLSLTPEIMHVHHTKACLGGNYQNIMMTHDHGVRGRELSGGRGIAGG